MRRLLCLIPVALAVATPAAAQLSAEPQFRAGTWMVTLEVGGAAFTDFQRGQALSMSPGVELAEFERRVSARTSATAGAWVGYWFNDIVGLRVGAAWTPSAFRVWNEESAQQFALEHDEQASRSYAGLSIRMAEASAVFRFPTTFGRVTPYARAGAGIVQYVARDDAELPPEARRQFATGKWNAPAGVIGLGAAIPLQRSRLLLSFELTDHVTRTPLDDRGRGESFELGGVPFQIDPDPDSGTDGVGLTNHLRLVLGATLPIR